MEENGKVDSENLYFSLFLSYIYVCYELKFPYSTSMKKNDKNTTLQDLIDLQVKFRDEHDWQQFHNPKDLAIDISIEAGELLEHFLWQNIEVHQKKIQINPEFRTEIENELSDIIGACFLFAESLQIDITQAMHQKLSLNAKKYPVEKAKGKPTKYDKL